MLQAGAGGLENRLHVLQTLLGLLLDVVGNRAGRRIGSALARDEDQALEAHARANTDQRAREDSCRMHETGELW